MGDVKVRVGQRVRDLRTRRGLSQERLALESDLDRTYINSVENGRRNVTILSVEKIALGLGVSLREFFSSPLFDEDSDEQLH